MPRPKEFDREEALGKAMELFWTRGYEATTLDDLQKAMGIGRQSLYDTFGDKNKLFLSALRLYGDLGGSSLHASLDEAKSVKKALRDVFLSIAAEPEDCRRRGCLMVSSVMELAARDESVARIVQESVTGLENTFARALKRAKENGEIDGSADTRALARFFVTAFLGLRVVAKANPDAEVLRDITSVVLSVLK